MCCGITMLVLKWLIVGFLNFGQLSHISLACFIFKDFVYNYMYVYVILCMYVCVCELIRKKCTYIECRKLCVVNNSTFNIYKKVLF